MSILPIQVTDEGVLIPKMYLHDATEFEVVVADDHVLVRPKLPADGNKEDSPPPHRYSFIGIAHTRNPRASVEAEEILEREVDRRSGWTHSE